MAVKETLVNKSFKKSYLKEDFSVEGIITTKEKLHIDGKVKGSVTSDSLVYLGEPCVIEGKIDGCKVQVDGYINGDINVTQQLDVLAKGRLNGDIYVPPGKVIIHVGSSVVGKCHIKNN